MTKQTKPETKQEAQGINQGVYENLVLVPQVTKREQNFDEIKTAIEAGKQYVMRVGYSRNSVYTLIRKLKDDAKLDVVFGITETEKDGNKVRQFVLFKKKEKKA